MLGLVVFIGSFLFLFGVTLVVPSFPPGEIIHSFLGMTEINSPIPSIYGEVFVNGIINGLIFGFIGFIVFSLLSRPSKEKVILPAHVPGYATFRMSNSDYVPPKTYPKRPVHQVRRSLGSPLDQKVVAIEGIGPTYGKRLRNSGVWTVEDLLKEGRSKSGRYYLAKKIGVSPYTILKWVYRADFFRIRGIGKQYSSLLESAGVNSVVDLSRRNPVILYEILQGTNWKNSLVRRTPPYNMVKDWVERARRLRPILIA